MTATDQRHGNYAAIKPIGEKGGGSMALRDFFARLFGVSDKRYTYARMLEGGLPIFSQFGQDVYASDVVQMAIDCIASEVSKLQPRHIREDSKGIQDTPASALNRLFRISPNPLMTTRDFLEKVTWLLFMNYNCFIYPTYDLIADGRGGQYKEYTALFPLNPTMVEFLEDEGGVMFVRMTFPGGDRFTLPYSEVIHLRKKFSVNGVLGGGASGQPDNQSLLKVLQINDTVMQGLDKAIKTSLSLRGILKINTLLDNPERKAERERFEAALAESKSGIMPMDLKGDYIDLKPDPKIIDKDTLAFLQGKILDWYGVPVSILAGTFNDEEYQAFYEKTLEPLVISFGQAFTKTLFTAREIAFGNEVVFYHRNMMYLSTKSKLELLKTAGEQGLLTDNQKLAILGYPPLADGNRRTISLNYISVEIADEYQLKRAGMREPSVSKQEGDEGGAGEQGKE